MCDVVVLFVVYFVVYAPLVDMVDSACALRWRLFISEVLWNRCGFVCLWVLFLFVFYMC